MQRYARVDNLARQEWKSNRKKYIAIAGGKGGVGKTVITAAMGIALAEKGVRTTVVDADFSGASLHQILGIIAPPLCIRQFIQRQESDLNKLLLETPFPNLNLLAGSYDFLAGCNIGYSAKQKILKGLQSIDADSILLDIGAGTAYDQLDFFNAADINIVVITPEPMSIQDGYNFIKLSLYRRLYRKFRRIYKIRRLFDKLYHSPDVDAATFYREIDNCFAHLDDETRKQWHDIVQRFYPVVILNMVECEGDLEKQAALTYAVKDILKVRMKNGGRISFDDAVRQSVRAMDPNILMQKSDGAARDIRAIVDSLSLMPVRPGATANSFNGAKTKAIDRVICSIKCSLWESCSFRNGGYPCRLQAVGYIKQLDHKA